MSGMRDATMSSEKSPFIEIIRQLLYTRDIQPTSKPQQICGHLRSCYDRTGYCVARNENKREKIYVIQKCRMGQKWLKSGIFILCIERHVNCQRG